MTQCKRTPWHSFLRLEQAHKSKVSVSNDLCLCEIEAHTRLQYGSLQMPNKPELPYLLVGLHPEAPPEPSARDRDLDTSARRASRFPEPEADGLRDSSGT